MPLLPYERLEIESPLPPVEVCARLASVIEPRRLFRFGRDGARDFEGWIDGNAFEVQRIIGYQNAFLPRIAGVVEPAGSGSRITATLKLHPFVAVFMAVWMGAVLVVGVPMMIAMLLVPSVEPDRGMRLIPPGVFLAGWLLVSGSFTFEARRARALLSALAESLARAPGRS
ncbi:MAG TPA: hypothetical protein VFQ45_12305 [Longimicrobium sp.]|nr:hypothetical protein [Longimicrobium sp.]